MIIRTIEFVYHTSKYILKRSIKEFIKRVLVLTIEILITVPLGFYISAYLNVTSYMKWIILAIIIGLESVLIVGIINSVIYKDDLRDLISMIKGIIKRKEEN